MDGSHSSVAAKKQTGRNLSDQADSQILQALIETLPHPCYILNAVGVYLGCNEAFAALCGLARSDVVNRKWTDLVGSVPPELAEIHRTRDAPLISKGTAQSHEVRITCATGDRIDYLFHKRSFGEESGGAAGIVVVMVETPLAEQSPSGGTMLEGQSCREQKMEVIGRLARGVAHNFRNQLTVVKGYCDLLLQTLDTEDVSRDPIEQIRQAADRATTITTQLLAFSQEQVLCPTKLDLNEVLTGTCEQLPRILGRDISLSVTPAAEPADVEVDRTRIEQTIMNLALNARDAMPRGGDLKIETSNVTLDDGDVRSDDDLVVGRYVTLTVIDTGEGMDEYTLERAFDPFFSSRKSAGGNGLGLSMIYGFIKQSGGHVEINSSPGGGTAIKLYLPQISSPK